MVAVAFAASRRIKWHKFETLSILERLRSCVCLWVDGLWPGSVSGRSDAYAHAHAFRKYVCVYARVCEMRARACARVPAYVKCSSGSYF